MEVNGEDNSFSTWEAGGACSKCSYILPPLVESAPTYFETGRFVCRQCEAENDLWEVVSARSKIFGFVPWSLTSLGAGHTSLNLPVETGKFYGVDICDYGAPPGSRILNVTCGSFSCSEGPITALVWRLGNDPRRILGTKIPLIAVPMDGGPTPRSGTVGITVVWIRKEESDGWLYLLNAFGSATDLEYGPALVFAHSAVEVSLTPLVANVLRQHASGENVKRFMTDSLKFSHTLNVLLPNLCALLSIPKMPEAIRTALNKLRGKRNRIVHEGATAANITHDDVSEGLSAAALGFEYVRYFGSKLSEKG